MQKQWKMGNDTALRTYLWKHLDLITRAIFLLMLRRHISSAKNRLVDNLEKITARMIINGGNFDKNFRIYFQIVKVIDLSLFFFSISKCFARSKVIRCAEYPIWKCFWLTFKHNLHRSTHRNGSCQFCC